MSLAYDRYLQLVTRIETFGQEIRQRYPAQVICHAGCDGCCYQQFTVFPVEAYHLAQAVAALTQEERQRLRQRLRDRDDPWRMSDAPHPCVLLEQGRCSVYHGRPLICRMHGYPLYSQMIESAENQQRDCCPLNFADVRLDEIDSQAVYNLDLVNQLLAVINHVFVQERSLSAQRVSIRQAVSQALEALDAATRKGPA
jgi:Fe-S-cluster containining protein